MEGTWFARTPISPDSAGMLTWTLRHCLAGDDLVTEDDSRQRTHPLICRYSIQNLLAPSPTILLDANAVPDEEEQE